MQMLLSLADSLTNRTKMNNRRVLARFFLASVTLYSFVYLCNVQRSTGIYVGIGPWPVIERYRIFDEVSQPVFKPANKFDRLIRSEYWRDFEDVRDL